MRCVEGVSSTRANRPRSAKRCHTSESEGWRRGSGSENENERGSGTEKWTDRVRLPRSGSCSLTTTWATHLYLASTTCPMPQVSKPSLHLRHNNALHTVLLHLKSIPVFSTDWRWPKHGFWARNWETQTFIQPAYFITHKTSGVKWLLMRVCGIAALSFQRSQIFSQIPTTAALWWLLSYHYKGPQPWPSRVPSVSQLISQRSYYITRSLKHGSTLSWL